MPPMARGRGSLSDGSTCMIGGVHIDRKRVDDGASRLREWMTADARNLTAALTIPFVVYETVSELRWYRANGVKLLSRAGTVAYMKARPVRFGLSLGLSVLPEVVGAVSRARRSRH